MGKIRDMSGFVSGRLTVLYVVEKPPESKDPSKHWLCKCECGNEIIVSSHNLSRYQTKSCGCLLDEYLKRGTGKDQIGERFGRLIVIERGDDYVSPSNKNRKQLRWVCKCDCGETVIVGDRSLTNGKTKSCGCLNREITSKLFKKGFGENTFNTLYSSYRSHAIKRGFDFDLSKEEFLLLTKEKCFYCGKSPSQIIKSRHNNGDYIYNGVDRTDSSIGYNIDNCVSCCGQCNIAKMDIPQEEFLSWIKKVYIHLTEKNK